MKKQKHPFAKNYPYLLYWVTVWGGYMQIGNTEYTRNDNDFLALVDDNDLVYEGELEETIDETLRKAEKYLRKVFAPDNFDEETIADLEEEGKNRD